MKKGNTVWWRGRLGVAPEKDGAEGEQVGAVGVIAADAIAVEFRHCRRSKHGLSNLGQVEFEFQAACSLTALAWYC